MLNNIDFYRELGEKAAEARNQRDEARAQFHADHFRKARRLENNEDRLLCSKAYNDAYQEKRNVPKLENYR